MELLELRKRTFELIAPLKFDCYRAEDLLEQLIATAQKKDAAGLKKIIENVDTQRRYLFSESKDCLSKENFNLLTYSELQSYVLASLQHTCMASFYMELEYLLRVNARKPSDQLHALECDIVHTLTSQNRYSYNPKFFRMFLSAFVIYPQYFSCLREIEATVLEFEKNPDIFQ